MAIINDIATYTHPSYIANSPLWVQMEDTYDGERAIKSKTTNYLPMTPGMAADYANAATKTLATERYTNYIERAIYYNYFGDSIKAMLGIMHSKDPELIKLPTKIKSLETNLTPDGGTIDSLLTDLNKRQLIDGRVGILLDPTEDGFKVLQYNAKNILNWGYKYVGGQLVLEFVLLDETSLERVGLEYEEVEKYRLIATDINSNYYSVLLTPEDLSDINIEEPNLDKVIYPLAEGKMLTEVPFVFINVTDNIPDIDLPPLENLSNLCVHIYKGEADYRQYLFQMGQSTLFVKGLEEAEIGTLRVGAGTGIFTSNDSADCKFVGVNDKGLPENRTSLENLHQYAISIGVSLVDSSTQESGTALAQRVFIKTANMTNMAVIAAQGLSNLLKIGANWLGIAPDVEIQPNLDFSDASITAKELRELWSAKKEGLPISKESVHLYLANRGYTEKTLEEELKLIEAEMASETTEETV